ncbi:alpha-amylase family glycosyl hydrolase [Gracilibacillus oryzae]|nr:alpha-amylase family glycosyl hydrolase [Gracilibacillus oryzae]
MKKFTVKCFAIIAFILFILPVTKVEAAVQLDERIYYILVDRYVNGNSNNDFQINIEDPEAYHGGDIAGIINELPKIKQKGFTAINLSPIMESTSFTGFDTMDHQSINENFGTMEELQTLVEKAHEEDLMVIMDFVLSQVDPDHPFASEEQSNGLLDQPLAGLEYSSDSINYIMDSINFWVDQGVDGFHLYVNESTDPQLVQQIKETLADKAIILDGVEYDGVSMNHAFHEEAVNLLKQPGQSLAPLLEDESVMDPEQVNYMESVLTNRFTFETVREGYHPVTRWKLATTLLYTLPGSSLFYQGLEVPMDNGKAEPDLRMAELNKADEEIIQHIEKLASIRNVSPALTEGDFELVDQAGALTVFKRTAAEETMYIAINNDTKTQVSSLEDIGSDMQLTGLLEDNIVREHEDGTHRIVLERESSNLFIVEQSTGMNWFFIALMIAVFGGFIAFIIAYNIKVKRQTK